MSDTPIVHTAPAPHETYRVRYPLKIRRLTVARIVHVTPTMIRVTVAGPDLDGFESRSYDDHVKLFFARPGEDEPALPTFGPNGPVFPEGRKPIARDYTPRRYDAATGELDLDFAVHEAGPATEWAVNAGVGSTLHVAGPRGSMIVPDDFDWYLLVGDDTALPAIARRLEELRPAAKVTVIVEVGSAADEMPLPSQASASITWLHRGDAAPGEGRLLDDAVAAFRRGEGEGFAWVACESDTAKRLRAILVGDLGLPKQRVKASGYWKRGLVSYHDTHDD